MNRDHELLPLTVTDDPLELKIKRSRYSRDLLRLIFRTPGSYLGKYNFNWMAAGALVDMIEAIFTSNEGTYRARLKALKGMGMSFRPQQVHFDVFRVVVAAFPMSVHRDEIVTALKPKHPNLSTKDVYAATEYLKHFTVKICGFSILPDFEGGVRLADIDTRMRVHVHNRKTMKGIENAEEEHGVKTLRELPRVRELPPSVQIPLLDFEDEQKELPDASD